MSPEKLNDLLKIEGVYCKGFGVVPKFVLLDKDISLEAKAIYAYLCSLAGNGTTAFPSRDTIIHHLHISKNRYYRRFRELLDNGYITIQKDRHTFPYRNIYNIVLNPKKYQDFQKIKSNPNESQLKSGNMKSFGYGLIPYVVMIDSRLNIKAKGLYAYFCSYTGSGDVAFPKKDTILYHLNIGEKAYYKYYNQLVSLNYLSVVQRKVSGKYSVNDYYINDTPNIELVKHIETKHHNSKVPYSRFEDIEESNPPYSRFEDIEESNPPCSRFEDIEESNPPCSRFEDIEENNPPCSRFRDSRYEYSDNEYNNINNLTKNKYYHNQSINQSNLTDRLNDIFNIIGIDQISHKDYIESIKGVLTNLWITRRVNNTIFDQETIENLLLHLTPKHIDRTIENINEASKKKPIINITEYYKTALVNSAHSLSLQANADTLYQENNNDDNTPSYDIEEYIRLSMEELHNS